MILFIHAAESGSGCPTLCLHVLSTSPVSRRSIGQRSMLCWLGLCRQQSLPSHILALCTLAWQLLNLKYSKQCLRDSGLVATSHGISDMTLSFLGFGRSNCDRLCGVGDGLGFGCFEFVFMPEVLGDVFGCVFLVGAIVSATAHTIDYTMGRVARAISVADVSGAGQCSTDASWLPPVRPQSSQMSLVHISHDL